MNLINMHFALATTDGYQCVLESFLRAGWHLDKLFVCPSDWMFDNKQVIARALELGASIQHSPITTIDMEELGIRGCNVLVVASYTWKIPDWSRYLEYAVNFHPSPLPEARGPYPQVRAILEERSSWAVTCHKISERFDQGDILDTEGFVVDHDENHETLRLKSQMTAGKLAERVARNFGSLWSSATPQDAGSYWPLWSEQDRTIDFTQPVEAIMRRIRAFGDLECMATVNDVTIFIHRAKGWVASHSSLPGKVVHASSLEMVVTAADGFIAITEWDLNPPGAITSNLRQ